jgi:hypothetical protein
MLLTFFTFAAFGSGDLGESVCDSGGFAVFGRSISINGERLASFRPFADFAFARVAMIPIVMSRLPISRQIPCRQVLRYFVAPA